jgi:hypothetical protein
MFGLKRFQLMSVACLAHGAVFLLPVDVAKNEVSELTLTGSAGLIKTRGKNCLHKTQGCQMVYIFSNQKSQIG